ncbi:glycoside hydrolase family 3 C-terminal domain-containing protein [Actinocatenispora comari]|uniref:Glycosyl hydrolase n=1 Tax=Actinocatenispora comari TaxID=2807577 RepID=A0A8J4AKA1_9ACTN|nr:glycoside hydrolase family 3 C-terminal domain-containing protein [Actinocatenispora comari]GIL30887.1 glycosyl hydrolase [Actinocatenispora comari]
MVRELSLAEQASLTSGAGMWETVAVPGAVPALTVSDGPHGIRRPDPDSADELGISESIPATCFPPAVTLGCSWDPELARRVGAALAVEARALGVGVILGPGVNIKRSPLCGRNFEYFAEDPYHAGVLGAALVTGIQSGGVGACVKHFAANNQETDRLRVDADVDEQTLREIYLPAFERIVREARPAAVMCSYNKLNGTYASQLRWLLTALLRDEWGFDGVVVSDWGAVNDRVAALAAGLDLEMPPTGTDEQIVDAVHDGRLSAGAVATAAGRVAALAHRYATTPHAAGAGTKPDAEDAAGVGTKPDAEHAAGAGTKPDAEHAAGVGTKPDAEHAAPADAARAGTPGWDVDAHHALAAEVARSSAVLLKNDGALLPLDPAAAQRIAVLGELARTPRYQGGGSSHVTPTRLDAAWPELRRLAGERTELTFAAGYHLDGTADAELAAAAVGAAAGADVAVLFLGLPDAAESEGVDRTSIDLPADQLDLLRRVTGTGTRVVLVLAGGGVLAPDGWWDTTAILAGFLPGQAGGTALAQLLFGVHAPAGRLTETIPLRLADTPSYLHFPGRDGHVRYGEGRYVGYRYFDTVEREVAYPFGHGLSYTTFEYHDLDVRAAGENRWRVEATVTNTGDRFGHEVAQLYVAFPAMTGDAFPGDRPRHELRGFAKVALAPGESAPVRFELAPRDLAEWSVPRGDWQIVAGGFTVELGASSRDIRLRAELTTPGDGYVPPVGPMSTVTEWLAHPVGGPLFTAALAPALDGQPLDPALVALARSLPLAKLSMFPVGLTPARIADLVAQVAQHPS